jgi:hypothetical protein
MGEEQKIQYLNGKTKAALFDAGLLSPADYQKPLEDIDLTGILIPDEAAMEHSIVGDFISPSRYFPNGRLSGGGHAFSNVADLERRGIPYNITRTASNSVIFGNIPSHKEPFKQSGSGQAWFPRNWTEHDIASAGIFVANRGIEVSEYAKELMYKGVNVRVQITNERISSINPSYDQP